MPIWSFEGNNNAGEFKRGEIEAESEADAKAKLAQADVKAFKIKKKQKDLQIVIPGITDRVPQKSLVIFTRQMATMIDAGLPLVQCLDLLSAQEPNPPLKKTLLNIKASVEGGVSFSEALRKHPRVFEDLYVNLVAAGEIGGILDTIMNRLAEYIEKAAETRAKVKGAMKYPITVLIVSLAITAGLLWKVVPTFAAMFSSLGDRELPAITVFMVNLSENFVANIPYLIGGTIALIAAYKAIRANEKGRFITDKMFTKMPIFGNLIIKASISKFTRTLGTLVGSGVPILDAMEIVAKTSGNKVIEKGVLYTRDRVAEGKG